MSHKKRYYSERFNWESIAQPAVLLLGILAAVIPLHMSIRDDIRTMEQRMDTNRGETQAILQGIREDMKEFHGRLCAIEERNRK